MTHKLHKFVPLSLCILTLNMPQIQCENILKRPIVCSSHYSDIIHMVSYIWYSDIIHMLNKEHSTQVSKVNICTLVYSAVS